VAMSAGNGKGPTSGLTYTETYPDSDTDEEDRLDNELAASAAGREATESKTSRELSKLSTAFRPSPGQAEKYGPAFKANGHCSDYCARRCKHCH
jgi:hypothetical protein